MSRNLSLVSRDLSRGAERDVITEMSLGQSVVSVRHTDCSMLGVLLPARLTMALYAELRPGEADSRLEADTGLGPWSRDT